MYIYPYAKTVCVTRTLTHTPSLSLLRRSHHPLTDTESGRTEYKGSSRPRTYRSFVSSVQTSFLTLTRPSRPSDRRKGPPIHPNPTSVLRCRNPGVWGVLDTESGGRTKYTRRGSVVPKLGDNEIYDPQKAEGNYSVDYLTSPIQPQCTPSHGRTVRVFRRTHYERLYLCSPSQRSTPSYRSRTFPGCPQVFLPGWSPNSSLRRNPISTTTPLGDSDHKKGHPRNRRTACSDPRHISPQRKDEPGLCRGRVGTGTGGDFVCGSRGPVPNTEF